MSDIKNSNPKTKRRQQRYMNHPEVLASKSPHMKAYELYWRDLAGTNRLCRAVTLQAAMQEFHIFGVHCPRCSYCNPFLGGEIRREPPLAPQPSCLTFGECTSSPWVLTKAIYKAIDKAKEEMTFRQIGDGRDVAYEDTINSIYDNISFESLDTVLTNHGKDIGWLEEREEEFKIWLECFYYSYEAWDSDYEKIQEDYIDEIEMQETLDSLPY